MTQEKSKYWNTMVDILEKQFPKGECKERGEAMVMLSYIEMMLQGVEFEDGEPREHSQEKADTIRDTMREDGKVI